MSLEPGTRLGRYEIEALVGAGGMGEVYRARDTRLPRSVAIKVLPKELSDDAVRRQRFEREAKTISSLSHPNICALYDVADHAGDQYLVMEYLEGETLAQRLHRGAVPLDQAMHIAIGVTDALVRAHRQNIVHRDLKPGNIMLTRNGAKLLDFGLARLCVEPAGATSASTQMLGETRDAKLTGEGFIVGTFQYMAPEQLEGREVDSRTDLFAMGAVIYEMVTGRPPFAGRSKASLIAAILTSEPARLGNFQPLAPPALERLVRRCLAKDPDQRWQSAADLCDELRWIAAGGSGVAVAPPVTATQEVAKRLPWLLVFLFVAFAAGIGYWRFVRGHQSPRLPLHLGISLPSSEALAFARDRAGIAISPDGKYLAYTARYGDTSQLYLRALDRLESTPVQGSEGAYTPFFSPDGRWLGFFAQGAMKKTSVAGGQPLDICPSADAVGASWGSDDAIYFTPLWTKGVWRVSARGGQAELVVAPEPGKSERAYLWPEVLPGGNTLLFTAWTGGSFDEAHILALRLDTHERRTLIEGGSFARYLPTGHVVYARGSELFAVPFDTQRLEVRGNAVPVVSGVMTGASAGDADFAFSQDGTLLYVPGGLRLLEYSLVWVSPNGDVQPLSRRDRSFEVPRLSPDARHIAVVIAGSTYDVWLYDVARDSLTRLTFGGDDNYPVWSPDGSRIAFNSSRSGVANLYVTATDGSGTAERLTTSEYAQYPGSWSPDGKFLAYTEESHPNTGDDIWLIPMRGDRKPQPLIQTPFDEWQPRFSPDGKWLAFTSTESGSPEVYVQPFPGLGAKWKISTDGGIEPLWSRDGRQLFYRNGDKMMAAAVETSPAFTVSSPRLIFDGPYAHISSDIPNYDVAPDGRRLLMVRQNQQKAAFTQLNVVVNWFDELKLRVGKPRD